jgi:hypothetical protein
MHIFCAPPDPCIVAVDHPISYHTISAHQHTKIPYRGSTPRHVIPLCWTQPPREPAFDLTPHTQWHGVCEYRRQHLHAVTTTGQCGTSPHISSPTRPTVPPPSPLFLTCRLPMRRPTPNSSAHHLLPVHAVARQKFLHPVGPDMRNLKAETCVGPRMNLHPGLTLDVL